MAVYGQYETVTELGRNGSVTVSRARPADGGWDVGFEELGSDASFVVKAFHIRTAEDAGGPETKRFLKRAAAQRKAAFAVGQKHWAPVVDFGEARGDAYYVSEYFPRSAAKLAKQAPADGATLHAVVTGVLEGLMEMRRAQGRAHGNLKATNVLIRGAKGAIESDDIVLCDPALDEDAEIAGETEDLYNVGELIHELVLGGRFAGQHVWPLGPSQRWAALGRHGEHWRDLANRLLSPRAAENWLRVDDVLEEVSHMRVRRKKPVSKKVWALAAMLLILGCAAIFVHRRHVAQWRDLCRAHQEWLGPLAEALDKSPPEALKRDAYLNERVILPLAEARNRDVPVDPREIAQTDIAVSALVDRAPLSPGAIWKTHKSAQLARRIEQALSRGQWKALDETAKWQQQHRERGWDKLAQYAGSLLVAAERNQNWLPGIENLVAGHARLARLDKARQASHECANRLSALSKAHPALKDKIAEFELFVKMPIGSDVLVASNAGVDALAKSLEEAEIVGAAFEGMAAPLAEAAKRQRAYEVRGWAMPASSLTFMIDRAKAGSDLKPLGDELVKARQSWEQIETAWSQIERRRRALETSGDRILATYREFVAQAKPAEAPDLASLAKALEQVNSDPSWEAAARKAGENEWAKIDALEFAKTSEVHRSFGTREAASTQDLRRWVTEVENYDPTKLATATVKPHVVETTKPVVAATTQKAPDVTVAATTQKSPDTRPVVIASTQKSPDTHPIVIASTQKSPDTQPTVVATTQQMPDPAIAGREAEITAFISELREVGLTTSEPKIKQAWRDDNAKLADALAKDRKLYTPEVKARREAIKRQLLQLDNAYKTASAPTKVQSSGSAMSNALVETTSGLSSPVWAAKLDELIAQAAKADEKFEDALTAALDADEQWRGSVARFVVDAGRVEQLLAQGYGLTDKPAQGQSIALLLAATLESEFYKNERVAAALAPLVAPVTALEKTTDATELRKLAVAADGALGVRMAAWSKLPKQATRATIDEDLKLSAALLSSAQTIIKEPARVTAVKNRLETDLRTRWEVFFNAAATNEDVLHAIGLRPKIPGADLDDLKPPALFNLALHELRNGLGAPGEVTKNIAAPAARLKTAAAKLDAAQARQPAVSAVLAILPLLDQPAGLDFSTLGPMSALGRNGGIQWGVRADEASGIVTYRTALATELGKEEVALVFRRVSTGERNSWLSTSEIPMGLFADLITATNRWTELREKRLLPDNGASRPGPRVWEWPRVGRSPAIARTLVWLGSDFVPGGVDHYPDTIGSEFNRSVIRNAQGGRSEELNPSRRMPMQYVPPGAAMMVASIAGCRLPTAAEWQSAYSRVGAADANLRDATWLLHLRHVNSSRASGRFRPDAGIFTPAGEKPTDDIARKKGGGEWNDGVLWFRESPMTASNFINIAGNVAEYVSTADGKIHVIGASALSPPSRAIDEPFAVQADQSAAGFSDVGFRLAFDEPPGAIERLREAAGGEWWVIAK